jgi:hypothetical protein
VKRRIANHLRTRSGICLFALPRSSARKLWRSIERERPCPYPAY